MKQLAREDILTTTRNTSASKLHLVDVLCCVCDEDDATPVAVGEDFEYHTTADTFLAVRCKSCGLVYLDPRPTSEDFPVIYPANYHAFAFDAAQFGFVFRVRRALEAQRMKSWLEGLRRDATLVDVGCGDGFHLAVLESLGYANVRGVDTDERAVAQGRRNGFDVLCANAEDDPLEAGSVDAALAIQTLEHVEKPLAFLTALRRMLRPGGRLLIVTDNTDSADRQLFKGRHWGGYHFPRHLTLFDRDNLTLLADRAGLHVRSIETIASPVNWTYSIRNALVDYGAPAWLYERFSLTSVPALGAFTIVDAAMVRLGRGALLRAVLERP